MKTVILSFVLLFCGISSFAQLPYNPDSDANGLINVTDLVEMLTYYGQVYFVEGVVPINAGGTDADNSVDARANLELSAFRDSIMVEGEMTEMAGLINGMLIGTDRSAIGFECQATGIYSHSQGYQTIATGAFSHAENRYSSATGTCAHAEGEGTLATATAAHAEGFESSATSTAAHSEGYQTQASGAYAHAQNRFSVASGTCAHAEGENCQAIGTASHAQGIQTIASGARSHAAGLGTVADQDDQTTVGTYNTEDNLTSLFVVGNGDSDGLRSDAFVVLQNGDAMVSGDLDVQGTVMLNGDDLSLQIQQLQAANQTLQQQVMQLQSQLSTLLIALDQE